jgi:2-haloalkanoic acid dehalogenase type II
MAARIAVMEITDFKVLSFDCYGTLIDWEAGILAALAPWRAERGIGAADDRLLESFGRHEHAIQDADPSLLYTDVLRRVMRAIGAEHGVTTTGREDDALALSVEDWPAFPDTVEALGYLKRHYRLAILSNIDATSFRQTQPHLEVEFDAVLTAQAIGSYKPDRRNFEALVARLGDDGVTAPEILHTAQSLYHDIAPAGALGLATCWIDRRAGKPGAGATPPSDAVPDFTFPTLGALADRHRALAGG